MLYVENLIRGKRNTGKFNDTKPLISNNNLFRYIYSIMKTSISYKERCIRKLITR